MLTCKIEVEIQDVYDTGTPIEKRLFLLDNISDLDDEDIIQEFINRKLELD